MAEQFAAGSTALTGRALSSNVSRLSKEVETVQIESRLKRHYWKMILLGTIPDAAIAGCLAWYFEIGLIEFLAVLVGFQAVYFSIWIKNSIWSWFMFSYGGVRQYLASHFLDYLRKFKFPEPELYEKSADEYFLRVSQDENVSVDIRLGASREFGTLSFLQSSGEVQKSMQISMAYEDALENYKKTFPVDG